MSWTMTCSSCWNHYHVSNWRKGMIPKWIIYKRHYQQCKVSPLNQVYDLNNHGCYSETPELIQHWGYLEEYSVFMVLLQMTKSSSTPCFPSYNFRRFDLSSTMSKPSLSVTSRPQLQVRIPYHELFPHFPRYCRATDVVRLGIIGSGPTRVLLDSGACFVAISFVLQFPLLLVVNNLVWSHLTISNPVVNNRTLICYPLHLGSFESFRCKYLIFVQHGPIVEKLGKRFSPEVPDIRRDRKLFYI